MKKQVTTLAAAAGLSLAGLGLAGCTTAVPALSECAMTTNGGFGSSGQGITSVTHPGGKVSVGSGETAWYYPCNARNFVTGSGGDRAKPGYAVRTASSGTGANLVPGMPVYAYTSVYFTANQNEAAMKAFLPFCLKYTCATNASQVNTSTSGLAHSSQPGWENMLLENMGPAIDRASVDAVREFPPSLWQDSADWPRLGDVIAANLDAELATETGSKVPFFCGDASTQSKCLPMTVLVNNVVPEDASVEKQYNEEVTAEQAGAANAARLRSAQELYGKADAGYFLGIMDLAQQCPKCVINVGTPAQVAAGQ